MLNQWGWFDTCYRRGSIGSSRRMISKKKDPQRNTKMGERKRILKIPCLQEQLGKRSKRKVKTSSPYNRLSTHTRKW